MFTRKTLFAVAFAGVIGAGTIGAAQAQPGPGGPGGPEGWHHGGGLFAGVSLTDDQQTKLHTLMESARTASHPLHEQLHALHEQIDTALLGSGSVSAATLTPLVQQEEAVMQQLDAQHLATELSIRNMLTTDQLAKASSTHAQLEALHAQEHALHTGDGGPPD